MRCSRAVGPIGHRSLGHLVRKDVRRHWASRRTDPGERLIDDERFRATLALAAGLASSSHRQAHSNQYSDANVPEGSESGIAETRSQPAGGGTSGFRGCDVVGGLRDTFRQYAQTLGGIMPSGPCPGMWVNRISRRAMGRDLLFVFLRTHYRRAPVSVSAFRHRFAFSFSILHTRLAPSRAEQTTPHRQARCKGRTIRGRPEQDSDVRSPKPVARSFQYSAIPLYHERLTCQV